VPLAFAFIATLGPVGLVTMLLKTAVRHQPMRWLQPLSFWGLTLTYLFFQIPLMILIITPALDGLKREWREAAEVLGATGAILAHGGLPILFPSLLGTFALLFANSLRRGGHGLCADRLALNIVPIMLFAQIRGDVLGNPHLGYALAFGMIVVTGLANGLHRGCAPAAEGG
jgi:putative spermidine/putrescine transport system permease protein